jgi:formamidopyrimidine-DNA glycosylase
MPEGDTIYRTAERLRPLVGEGATGGRIRSRRQGELARVTYWCPSCQPTPADAPPA